MTRIRSSGQSPVAQVHDVGTRWNRATLAHTAAARPAASSLHAAANEPSRAPAHDDSDSHVRAGDITLEQLLDRLRTTARDPGSHRAAAPLMALIASDIRAGLHAWPTGLPRNPARSLRAWRQRYNGLGRDLQGT
ncbi:hypothetical protein [Luteimonas kalidii]|uniref:Uncharacterized protein n=1 Tax=Luteimonas kalidii TaxID=3042025 RepID=A0ABT6JX13_9GAMM|nr:hypothetical protein [Luteimonas kalidii]MDH5835239.1 hypothetical protein [Luteimonas kalidii]